MKRDKFMEYIANTYVECVAILQKKNADYASGDDPFQNFRMSKIAGISPEQAILVRTLDKMARISNVMRKGETAVLDEKLEDTINDAINYLAILKAYLSDGQNTTSD